MGIPAETLPKIFDAFEQGSRASLGGLGLGLAITKAIVDLHSGTITAASSGPGHGSTFALELPTAAAVEPLITSVISHPLSSPGAGENVSSMQSTGLRILLVDDHADTLRSMERLLRLRGYLVCTALTVAAALDSAANQTFDLLISDVGLPDGTGMDLMRELRRVHGEALRGIALSGYGMEEDITRSRDAGFDEHLTKPVDMATLEAVISGMRVQLTV